MNCVLIAIFLVNPALTILAKSPSSCGILCNNTDIDASPPLDFDSENVVHDMKEEYKWDWGISVMGNEAPMAKPSVKLCIESPSRLSRTADDRNRCQGCLPSFFPIATPFLLYSPPFLLPVDRCGRACSPPLFSSNERTPMS